MFHAILHKKLFQWKQQWAGGYSPKPYILFSQYDVISTCARSNFTENVNDHPKQEVLWKEWFYTVVSFDNSHWSMFTHIQFKAAFNIHSEKSHVIQSGHCWYRTLLLLTRSLRCSTCSLENNITLNLPKQIAFLSSFTTIPKWVQSAVKMWFLRGGEAMISNWRPLMYRPTPTQ